MISAWLPVNLKERLYYIDALRAFLMTYGIVLHANMFVREDVRYFIGESSHLFRMQTFFLVSGFFTAMIFFKSASTRTFLRRLASIMIPFAVFALFANPFANLVLARTAGSDQPFMDLILNGPAEGINPPLGITWHLHLWFLFVLAIFTCLYPLIKIALCSPVVLKPLQMAVDKIRWPSLTFLLLAGCIAFTSIFLRGVYFVGLEEHMKGHPFNHILVSTLEFIPFFVLGAALFLYQPLFDLFHRFFYGQMLVAFALLIALYHYEDQLKASLGTPVFELGKRTLSAFCSVYSANFLFNFFHRFFNNRGPVAKFLSDAAYSTYLLHLYILIGIFYFFYQPGETSPLAYLLAMAVTYAACLLMHYFVISKFKITRLLVNGKLPETSSSGAPK